MTLRSLDWDWKALQNNMRFVIQTPINQNYIDLYKQFDEKLFIALAPAFPKMELIRFDGSKKGDEIHLKLTPPGSTWISIITDDIITENEATFVDEGKLLPPGLKYWKHVHRIRKISTTASVIEDDITFKGTFGLLTLFLFPVLWLSFYPRKKAYVKYFKS